MQLLPLSVQLLAISTLTNHGCEAGFLLPGIWEKEGGHQKGRRQKTVSRRNYIKTSPFWLTTYPISLGRGLKTNLKDISLPSSQLLNTCSDDYIKFPTTVTVLAWEDHGKSCQSKCVSLGFTSLNTLISIIDRNPFICLFLDSPNAFESCGKRNVLLQPELEPESAKRPKKAWKNIHFMLRTLSLLSTKLLERQGSH